MNQYNNLNIGKLIDINKALQNNKQSEAVELILDKKIEDFETIITWQFVVDTISDYSKWLTWLNNNYKPLFNYIEEEYMTDIDKFYEKWNWYAILFENFCDGDYFKMDEAFKINVIAFFNHLTYLHEKNNLKI